MMKCDILPVFKLGLATTRWLFKPFLIYHFFSLLALNFSTFSEGNDFIVLLIIFTELFLDHYY